MSTVMAPIPPPLPSSTEQDPFSAEPIAATSALFTSPHTTAAFDASTFFDPLKINLKKQVRELLVLFSSHFDVNLNTQLSGTLDTLKSFFDDTGVTVGRVLDTLSICLGVPQLVEVVVRLFRPLLIDLFARWLDHGMDGEEVREERLAVLAYVVEVYEEVYPVMHEFLQKFFPHGPLYFVTTTSSLASTQVERLHRLLLTYFRIQQANRELPAQLHWSLIPLTKLIWSLDHNSNDNGVKLMAIRCYAYQSQMGEAQREELEAMVLGMKEGEMCSVDCWVSTGGFHYRKMDKATEPESEDNERVNAMLDGWVLPVLEMQRVRDMREKICLGDGGFYDVEEGEELVKIENSDLSPRVANIHGVLLIRHSSTASPPSAVIPTQSSITSLRTLALLISMRVPTLLTSSPSAGKTLLLNHLAGILYPETKNQIITIHLADTSLDPRSLLGSYISSPTQPGNFEWKEGVLIRAMHEGRWVVFEDIDRGSSEVLGVIKPLIESLRLGNWIGARAKLDVPSRGTVTSHQNFLIFATRSVHPSRNGKFAPPTFFGAHKWCETIVRAPEGSELREIVERRFERVGGCAARPLIDLWESVKDFGEVAGSRSVGLRELEKLCARVERLLPVSYQPMDIDVPEGQVVPLWQVFTNPTMREEMYLEARDIFFGAGATTTSAKAHLDHVAAVVGEKLGLDEERREWLVKGRTPLLDIEKDVNGNIVGVSVGRIRLATKQRKYSDDLPPSRPFAMHRPAVCLLSRIATSIALSEPVLLTGETGTGKTSIVTHLASLLGRSLISLNLSHQTESSDLIGGLKPVDTRVPASALQERFLELFGVTFSRKKNEKFETEVRKAVNETRWKRVVGLWRESGRLAKERLATKTTEESSNTHERGEPNAPRKRRKVDPTESSAAWAAFLQDVDEFEVQHVRGKGKFAFGFVEGPLVKALRSGDWILLDEINLASPETLECISGLLHGPTASITLTEQGSLEPVPRHPDFRLFACMNPATDVGKKDLPPNIRSRFTEIDVPPPDSDKDTLLSIISQYIGACAVGDKAIIMNVAEFYIAVKDLAERRQLADGANHRPHFSMRTLARALMFAADLASTYKLRRSVWEGCLMAFTMVLDPPSTEIVMGLMHRHLLIGVRNPKSMLHTEPSLPHGRSVEEFIKFGPFYLERGPYPEDPMEEYIMTPSVEAKLIDLARIITTRKFPVLIEGPTSSGKTSSIEYLARRTGHRFVRINNHEHTDIQEYLGSYVSDPLTGKLVFKDGLLVHALRNGDWIVLDELNLAPTDVLEALNRLLDDNRELVIPETQEVVRPHPHFMLFATQNPPGLYAGRKVLSRAFRNRFLEVHFQDVPQAELETILCQRCRIAPSYGKRIVSVFHELQKRRQAGRVFESKQSFATLRDLFRWANRDAVGYQELAENGYMLLAERARRDDDKAVVKEVIQSIMGVQIKEDALYDLRRPGMDMAEFLGAPLPSTPEIIWTKAMQRLYILVCRALKFDEPVLLVGETGSGKTSVCQVFADVTGQRLHGLNCHQNTETADIIGALRPVRNRSALEAEVFQEASAALATIGVESVDPSFETLTTSLSEALKLSPTSSDHTRLSNAHDRLLRLQSIFEWHDGPLVEAMRNGDVFLLDEISLADDSVLERLNSVLEPGRTIVLAEKGGSDFVHPTVKAAHAFKLIATMNPGGDYGKKELSPALRNRFTEIWVPRVDDRADLEMIVDNLWKHEDLKAFTQKVLNYTEWLSERVGDKSIASLRDIIAWVMFSNAVYRPNGLDTIPGAEIFRHAAHMTYLDGLSSLPQLSAYSGDALSRLKDEAIAKLHDLVPSNGVDIHGPFFDPAQYIQLGSFAIEMGPFEPRPQAFNLTAPTSRNNAMRILRACQLTKPILLEGSPGVGKTSLIMALANISGHHLCRINLSDQTDLVDLFGSDLPVEGGAPGEFAWRDAEFLKALQQGHWVLLDEMNLAPQAVLEGLNAVLDHRGTVYIPELGRSFTCHPSFRIFAAQNPLNQGGGRKGLPKSFVNRFTKVYVDGLTSADLLVVCQHTLPQLNEDVLRAMISFNTHLHDEVTIKKLFGRQGTPWEFNLRDVIRWGSLLASTQLNSHPVAFLRSVYLQRFRTKEDRRRAQAMFDQIFATSSPSFQRVPSTFFTPAQLQIGHFTLSRKNYSSSARPKRLIKSQLAALETLGDCVSQGWLAIITGPRDCGKSSLVRALADFTGHPLREVSINSATDTMDIIGSFEQADPRSQIVHVIRDVLSSIEQIFRSPPQTKDVSGILSVRDSLQLMTSGPVPQNMVPSLLQRTSELLSSPSVLSLIPQDLLQRIQALSRSMSSVGRFEWVDGPLIQAMRKGEWLLLDGANLCNPSVLDRLNSLCEPNGQLTLNERGLVHDTVEVVKPHPNFRLFMTVDPQHGELSRAMRNRGTEIFLPLNLLPDDYLVLLDYLRLARLSISTEHSNSMSLEFQAQRRGLGLFHLPQPDAVVCSGRPLDHFSPLSNMIDRFSSSLISMDDLDPDARTYFLSRTFHHTYTPYFRRILETCHDINGEFKQYLHFVINFLSSPQPSAAFSHMKDTLARTGKFSSEILSAHAMDSIVNELPNENNASVLLDTLDFFAAAFLHKKEQYPETSQNTLKPQHVKELLQVIETFLIQLVHLNNYILSSLPLDLSKTDLTGILPLLSTLNRWGNHLRTISSQVPLDHSAIQVITRVINDLLNEAPAQVHPLKHQAKHLQGVITLSSGASLLDLWSKWECDDLVAMLQSATPELRDLRKLLDNPTIQPDLRRLALRLLSMVPLTTTQPEYETQLVDIVAALRKQQSSEMAVQRNTVYTSSSILTLQVLARSLEHDVLESALDLASSSSHESLVQFVPIQQLSWILEAGKDPTAKYIQSIFGWLDSLFGTSQATFSTHLAQPDLMLQKDLNVTKLLDPSQLNNALMLCDPGRFTLQSMTDYEHDVDLYLGYARVDAYVPRQDLLETLFCTIATIIFQSSQTQSRATEQITQFPCDIGNFITGFLPEVLKTSGPSQVLREHLDSLRVLSSHTPEQKLRRLGHAWVALGKALIQLLVPDVPVDPVAIHNTSAQLQQKELHRIASEIRLHQILERVMIGNADSFILSALRDRLSTASAKRVDCIFVDGRNSIGQLHTYWAEIWQFRTQVIAESKIASLLQSSACLDDNAVLREQVMQESINGFHQRLDSVYPQFNDLNVLVKLGVSLLRLGLRLVVKASHINPETTRSVETLVGYPSISEHSKTPVDPKFTAISAFCSIYINLVDVELRASTKMTISLLLPRLEQLYDQALGLWLIDKAKESDVEIASQTLYRGTLMEHSAMTEAEVEEQEFLALFPDFGVSLSEKAGVAQQKLNPAKNLTDQDMINVCRLHLNLFPLSTSLQEGLSRVYQTRKRLLLQVMSSSIHELPDSLDASALAHRLRLVNDAQINIQTSTERHPSYNFYRDPNLSELKSATQVVITLQSFLRRLLLEWPEQMVLQHLIDRCDVILSFSLESPVAKVLSALELLLLQTDDWEMYANRDNSLSAHRQSLTDLIVKWRRLELSCWNGLLQSEASSFAEGASEWWFRLYNAISRGLKDATNSNGEDAYLESLIPLIDEFLSSSPLGQFAFRTQLLQSFGEYLSEVSPTKSGSDEWCQRRVTCIIHSTLQYYRQYHPDLQSYLMGQRAALDKEIKSFIKLASWKDINVQALRQSAQKTHHQLYKVIRKFREILREPVVPRLLNTPSTISETQPSSSILPQQTTNSEPIFPRDTLISATGPLSDLTTTLRKYERLVSSRIVPFLSRREDNEADDLATSIIMTSKELAEIPVPTGLSSEKRTKFLKSVLVRKRKAFSDLLKELKNAGFASSVKHEIMRQNSNALWLREQPVLNGLASDCDVGKGEMYYSRLLASLPKLRASLSDHHSDLQTRELQRALSFLESGFSMAINLRSRLAFGSDEVLRLMNNRTRLTNLSKVEIIFFQNTLVGQVHDVTHLACLISAAFTEVVNDLKVFMRLQGRDVKYVPVNEVESHLAKCNALKEELLRIEVALESTPLPVLRQDEHDTVVTSLEFFSSCISSLTEWSSNYPYLQYLFDPTRKWLSSVEAIHVKLEPSLTEQSSHSPAPLLNALLYTVQEMAAEVSKAEVDVPQDKDDDQNILKSYRETLNFSRLLSPSQIVEQLNTLLRGTSTGEELKLVLQCILPFLKVYENLARIQLATHARWTKALFKLEYVLCSTLLRLSKEGFCQPPEKEEEGDGEGETLETADGTGLGEGAGVENVSKEIEEESQVEGLKGDEGNQEREKGEGDDNAVEMSEDFGGALEDLPDDGAEDDEEDESDAESGTDPEERIENLDPTDPSSLDEKIWGDESGPQDSEDAEDKTGKDFSEEQSGTSEVVAKENNEKPKQEKQKEKEKDDEGKRQDEESKVEDTGEMEEEETGEASAAGAPIEDYAQDASTLDLPVDIDFDVGEEEKGTDTSEELEGEGDEDLPDETTMEDIAPEDMSFQDQSPEGMEHDRPQDSTLDDQEDTEDSKMEADNHDGQSKGDEPEEQAALEEVTARPDTGIGDGDDKPTDEVHAQDPDTSSTGQAGSSAANAGQKNATQDKAPERTGSYNNIQELSTDETTNDGKGSTNTGTQQGQNQSSAEQRMQTNPLRSLGDTLKEIRHRFDEILSSETMDQYKPVVGPSEAPPQLEYLQEDDEDQDLQALGPAGEEQVTKLDDLKFAQEESKVDPSFAMDIDIPLEPEQYSQPMETETFRSEQNSSGHGEDVEGAVFPAATLQPTRSAVLPDSLQSARDSEMEVDDQNIEAELRQWQAADFPDSNAEHMWRLYESMTHDLAYALCEQLRLILEPTLATRLRGDFRTGKRLNMKKIIPYIASDYTKDKIWLRRTKPSQREYQVLIAVDDSRSMAESHSIHLAYQTLALISKALSRLEAGDIAIAKFGGSVDILHGFDQGQFTDQAGTQVVNSFTFNQKATNVLSLVETSLRVLETARERRSMSSATAADLWQLEIIISDGICQDHEKLRTLLRKAEEQKVMIVFIVLDSLHSKPIPGSSSSKDINTGSILTMTKAEFKNVDGKMEMQLHKYLDSFPFEYYVVLRSVEALPEVLAGTLKQFFERISEE